MALPHSSWASIAAAGALTVLTLVVTTGSDGAVSGGSPGERAVVQPAARVVDERSESPRVEAPTLPGWCRHADACVDRRSRVAWLTRHGELLRGPVPVSVGARGHRTPHGRFHVEWKALAWTSTEYGLPMPFSVFFATGGIAFHAGPLDEPSHGCVHLRRHDASRFFARLHVGDVVVVH